MQIPGSQQVFGKLQGLPDKLQLPPEQEPSWHEETFWQKVPLVFRVQEPVCVVVDVEQPPPLHVGVMTERVRVPVLSQTLLKPPHALQGPKVTLPQLVPFVLLVHEPV